MLLSKLTRCSLDSFVVQSRIINARHRDGAVAILGAIPMVTHDTSQILIELGVAIVGLALLARFASRLGFSAIPLYLLAGLAFGNGGLVPLGVSENFIHIGAEIGVLLLLFMLGLEYTGEDLKANLQSGLLSGCLILRLIFHRG